jgi:transcriptional regulator
MQSSCLPRDRESFPQPQSLLNSFYKDRIIKKLYFNREDTFMYLPPHFQESRVETLHDLMRAHPLATVVTLSTDGLNANHIPLLLHLEPGPFGTLRGHVARSNPLVRDPVDNIETLAVFQGPQSYITPSWYPTKQEHGKVVPTWNYAVVHAHGALRVVDDAVWVRDLVETLTRQQEAHFSQPWSVSDAPQDFVDGRIGAIVGIEMVISKLVGKWKVSQNQPVQNQAGVVQGLKGLGEHGAAMADLVEQHGGKTGTLS